MTGQMPEESGMLCDGQKLVSCFKGCVTNLLACPNLAATLSPYSQHVQFAFKENVFLLNLKK